MAKYGSIGEYDPDNPDKLKNGLLSANDLRHHVEHVLGVGGNLPN